MCKKVWKLLKVRQKAGFRFKAREGKSLKFDGFSAEASDKKFRRKPDERFPAEMRWMAQTAYST
jgi:hypothetical protein